MRLEYTDGRHVKAMRKHMGTEVEAGLFKLNKASVDVIGTHSLDSLEQRLDILYPAWREDPLDHRFKQASSNRDRWEAFCLMRVWELACRAFYGDWEEPQIVEEQPPVVEEETPPVKEYFYADSKPPTEWYVRRGEGEYKRPVRCGKCSEWLEHAERANHAHRHHRLIKDIAWYEPRNEKEGER